MGTQMNTNFLHVIQTETERRMIALRQSDRDFLGDGSFGSKHKAKNVTFFFYGTSRYDVVKRKNRFLKKCEELGLNLNGED